MRDGCGRRTGLRSSNFSREWDFTLKLGIGYQIVPKYNKDHQYPEHIILMMETIKHGKTEKSWEQSTPDVDLQLRWNKKRADVHFV